ncbi:MAG: hypothetical protein H7338_19930 [Candidatus Sericytochromatia bacterium]|nr:hypothetical protein [Candidatus Sericytochromatia bacterium]
MSGLRIVAGANGTAANQRITLSAPKSPTPATGAAPATTATPATQRFVLADPHGSRLRELMARAGDTPDARERAALQSDLDRLRSEMGISANSPEVLATLAELSVASENVSAAQSRLTDLAAARAAIHLAKDQIRQSVPDAIRAQANAAPSSTQGLIGT